MFGFVLYSLLVTEPVTWAGAGRTEGLDGLAMSASVTTATGVSVAPGPEDNTLMARSPVQLTMDLGFRHPDFSWLELSPALLLEVEGRVGFGLAARARAFLPLRKVGVYGFVGVPAFLAPYTLFGVQGGAGMALPIFSVLSLTGEFTANVFFAGNDLNEGKALGKFDGSFGIRVDF